jgi:hypothetical protein
VRRRRVQRHLRERSAHAVHRRGRRRDRRHHGAGRAQLFQARPARGAGASATPPWLLIHIRSDHPGLHSQPSDHAGCSSHATHAKQQSNAAVRAPHTRAADRSASQMLSMLAQLRSDASESRITSSVALRYELAAAAARQRRRRR